MNSEQDEKPPETCKISQEDDISSGQGPIFNFIRMMGKTVGLARKAGTKTAEDMVNVSSKLRSLAARGAEKKQKDSLNSEIEQLRVGLRDLFTIIGERVCHLAKVDVAALQNDLQLKAMVLSAHERGEKIKNMTPGPDTDATEATTCAQEETADALGQEEEEEGNEDI